MATFRGISAATLGTGAVAAGGYSTYQFNQGGMLEKGKGALAGVGAAGLGAGALKVALGGMGRGGGREYAEEIASRISKKGSARMKLGGGLGLAAVGLGAKAAYDIDHGDIQSGMGYGAGAGVAAYAGYKSVSSGRRASAAAKGIRSAIKTAGSEATRNATMMKLGAGITVAGLGLGAKAYTDFKQGDTLDGLKYGAGAMATGFLAKSAFKTGLHSRAKSKAIDRALDASEKYALRAGRYKGFGKAGLAVAGAGALVTGAGVMTEDKETLTAGIATAGLGTMAATGSFKRAAMNKSRSVDSISDAVDISRTPRKALARERLIAKKGRRAVEQNPGFLGRTSYGGRNRAGFNTAEELAESVTKLRKINNRTGKVAAGMIGAAALGISYFGYGLING